MSNCKVIEQLIVDSILFALKDWIQKYFKVKLYVSSFLKSFFNLNHSSMFILFTILVCVKKKGKILEFLINNYLKNT